MTANGEIAVILGGRSSERDVSLRTGQAVMNALKRSGYQVSSFDPAERDWSELVVTKPKAAFICLHGSAGEDGTLQGFLQTTGIPYTSSGVLASALCFDKVRTKIFASQFGVLAPGHQIFEKGQDPKSVQNQLGWPVIVKPCHEGSTIGMTIVKNESELPAALELATKFDSTALIEEFIQGTEVTSSVLNGRALPLIEIRPKSGFYDYQSKYTAGQTEYILPAEIAPELEKQIGQTTENLYLAFGCRGAVRADYIIRDQKFYFLEINTIPGMTETSLLPKAAAAVGLSFDKLCEEILKGALN